MNPRAVLLILLAAAVVVALIVWWISRSAGVRRKDFHRAQHERDLALHAITQIEGKAAFYNDLDSVLAAEVRDVINTLRTNRLELYK